MKDLLALVADGRMRAALQEVLLRNDSLGIPQIQFDVYDHPERDPGVLLRAHIWLREFQADYRRALVLFDHEGCGRSAPAWRLAEEIQKRLDANGWKDRSRVLVLEPELEIWVWADSPHVAAALGWSSHGALRQWLLREGFLLPGTRKPLRPKEAMEAALRHVRLPLSTGIYRRIARRVGLGACEDPVFMALRETLTGWFRTQ